jgi:hypothetical protein
MSGEMARPLLTVVETAEFIAKNEMANLTPAQKNAMAVVVKAIKQQLER